MSTLAAAKSFWPLSVEYSLRYCLSSAREMSLHSAGTEGIAGAPAAGGAAVPGAFAGAAVPGAATAGAAAAPVSAGVPAAGDSSGMAPLAASRLPRERRTYLQTPYLGTRVGAGTQGRSSSWEACRGST